nr:MULTISPECIES: MaoC/PaaZ C-terminal domain-containing protein [Mycobacteriaceae]
MGEDVKLDARRVGRWTDEERLVVTRERIAAYAAATNDPIPAHLAGEVAPPVFAVVPVFKTMMAAGVDAIPAELFTRVLHSAHDIRFHRPIRPGDTLASRGRMIGYEGMRKGRRAQKGTRMVMMLETRTDAGALVTEQYVTILVLGFNAGEPVGELGPHHALEESVRDRPPVASVAQHVDRDQTFRYAAASGDQMPIHLDENVAIDAGLPGIIVHGLCTMAFASWAILTEVCGADVTRLQRIAVRFSNMVRPGDDLETRLWKRTEAETATVHDYVFETMRGKDVVITDGLAELCP